jgi:hypothetical protein
MSNAAMNGGDAIAPAGRACSKFVWQNSRFRRTGRFECCRIRTARPFAQVADLSWNRRYAPRAGQGVERAWLSQPAPAGHVLAAIGRQSSRLKCGGTAGGSQRIMVQRPSRSPAGALAGLTGRNSLANSKRSRIKVRRGLDGSEMFRCCGGPRHSKLDPCACARPE